MATEVQTAPELTIISRVASIPLVASSLGTIHTTLTSNPYTRSPYSYAEGISKTALSYAEPLQKRLAPLLVRADGLANKSLDVVESRYPYPFKTPTEDIMKDIKGHSDHAYDIANKTIDEKVKSPAKNVAQGIDRRFAPVVDYFEVAVNKVHSRTGSPTETAPSEPAQYQYQRAFALSKDLSDGLYTYSTEQINQLKAQSVLVQRASDAAHKVSAVASTSYGVAQERAHALSDVMLQELQKVQTSTSHLPAAVQSSFHDISGHLSATIHDLTAILSNPQDSLTEKVQKVRDTVTERVQPILEASAVRVQEILNNITKKSPTDSKEAVPNGSASNGQA